MKRKHKPGLAKPKVIFRAPQNPADWRPTPYQMEIYTNICRGAPFWREAQRLKTTADHLRDMCRQIDEFLVEKSIRDIRLIRVRHQAALEELYAVAMESFETSKRPEIIKESGNNSAGQFSKERIVEHAAGNSAFLGVAMDCLSHIREIWAANKKASDDPVDPGEPEDMTRVGGVPKAQLIRQKIQTLTLTLKQITTDTEPQT